MHDDMMEQMVYTGDRRKYIWQRTVCYIMISLKRILYHIDEATTPKEDTEEKLYISMKTLRGYFDDENLDPKVVNSRIHGQMDHNRHLFKRKKEGRAAFFRLSSEGYQYLNLFKHEFNPIIE